MINQGYVIDSAKFY